MGSLSLLQGIFATQGSNPGLWHCKQILYQLSHQGSPLQIQESVNNFEVHISGLPLLQMLDGDCRPCVVSAQRCVGEGHRQCPWALPWAAEDRTFPEDKGPSLFSPPQVPRSPAWAGGLNALSASQNQATLPGSPFCPGDGSGFFPHLPGEGGPWDMLQPQGPPHLPWASEWIQAQPLDEPHRLRGRAGGHEPGGGLCRELSSE